MNSPFDSGGQFVWDSTSLKLFETCPRKYAYKIIEGWRPHATSVHLTFGAEYATALESYHKAVAAGVDSEQAVCDVVHQALINTWVYSEVEGDEEPSGGQPLQFLHNTKTRENLIRTIIWYLDQFGADDSCTTLTGSEGQALVEHSFKLEVDNDIIFSGHLDRVVLYGDNVFVQDQKTTGSTITARFFDQFSPDTQMSMYSFAGVAILGSPVKGVMIDGAQIAVGFTRFERGFTFRTTDQLTEWYDLSLANILRARTAFTENYFPMNPSSCGNYGGCEFRHVCSKSPPIRDAFLRADFEKGMPWNPLTPR